MSEHESRWRAIMRIVSLDEINPEKRTFRVVLSGWDPRRKMTFPLSIVPEELQSEIKADGFILADVNLAAERSRDLKPSNFEAAPEPVAEDDLS